MNNYQSQNILLDNLAKCCTGSKSLFRNGDIYGMMLNGQLGAHTRLRVGE